MTSLKIPTRSPTIRFPNVGHCPHDESPEVARMQRLKVAALFLVLNLKVGFLILDCFTHSGFLHHHSPFFCVASTCSRDDLCGGVVQPHF